MSATEQKPLVKGMRWAAWIIGGVVLAFLLMMLIGEGIMAIRDESLGLDVASLLIILPILTALAGYIVSWWREEIGGLLLILVSMAFAILPGVGAQWAWSVLQALRVWAILGLPFLIVGGLFLLSWWFSRKAA